MAEFKMTGVFAQKHAPHTSSGWASVREFSDDRVLLETPLGGAALSVEGARMMARDLYRIARRVDKRLNPDQEVKK